MTIEELKKKYGAEGINLMINHLLVRVPLSPFALGLYDELKADLKSVLSNSK